MPPGSALKRKSAVSAGDDDTSTKRVNSEDFEQMFSSTSPEASTSSEASSSSPGSPTVSSSSTSSDKSDDDCPVTIWSLLEEHKVSGRYLPPKHLWPTKVV